MVDISLKKFRKLQRMTQEEFGQKLGYKGGYISTLEKNHSQISENFIDKLNDVFGFTKKGYTLNNSVDNSNKIINSHIKSSKISNIISPETQKLKEEVELLKHQLSEAKETIIALQAELLADARRNNTKNL